MGLHIVKANREMEIVTDRNSAGKVIKNWDPNKAPNPCGHFGATVLCTCKIRDRKCQTCGKVWVRCGGDWYEVVDPHKPSAPAGEGEIEQCPKHPMSALKADLAAARKALEEFDRLSSLGTMLSKPGGPDAEGISRLFAMGNQLEVLRKLLGVPSQAQPAPRADSPHPLAHEMLAAAASTGHEGTVRLAAQLANVPPCPGCGFVKQHCRCKPAAPAGEKGEGK